MVQLLCGHWLVSVDPSLGELVRGEIAVGSVWSVHVVVDPPVLDEHLRLEQAVEAPAVEEFVTQSPVERLDPGVLPGRARVDEDRADAVEPTPVSHRVSDELGAIVEPNEGGGTPFDDQAVQGGHDPVGVDGALDFQFDTTEDNRTLKVLNIVDEFTREMRLMAPT